MTTTMERRQVPRKRLERLGYIEIEPNNGGIVLNASDEGLCFHAIAPVEKNGPVRFSLLDHNRRIDARAELIWTDDMRKVGGLRFTSLSNDAREGISDWIAQPETSPEESKNSSFKFAMVSAFRTLGGPRFDKVRLGSPSPKPGGVGNVRLRVKLQGFSGGLITGFLVSVFLGIIFLASYTHRRELGRSLIRWGERLTASSEGPNSGSLAPVGESSLLGKDMALTSSATNLPVRSPAPAVWQKADVKPAAAKAIAPVPELKPSPAVIDMIHRKPSPERAAIVAGRDPVAPAASSVLAASSAAPATDLLPQGGATPGLVEGGLTPRPGLANIAPLTGFSSASASGLTMYFDIGRFKDELSAHNLSQRVGELGFPTTVTKRGHLWSNSYQVLVGPYGNPQEEKHLEHSLVAHGFKPRPFERGSRDFAFVSPLVLHASRLPQGDLTIRWESFVSDAKVKFLRGGSLLAAVDGRWMPGAAKYWRDEYIYHKNGDGSRTLLEIHFSGLNRALVFRD